MESVLQRFELMKKERMKFITETNEKANNYMSTIKNKLNTIEKNNNFGIDYNIDIESISNQLKKITSIINQYDFYYKNYINKKNNLNECIENKINCIDNLKDYPILNKNELDNINNIILSTQEFIYNNKNILLSNNNNEKEKIIQLIKEKFFILDNLLKIDYKKENKIMNIIINLFRRIRNLLLNNNIFNNNNNIKNYFQDDYNIYKLAKESRILKFNIIQENNEISISKHKFCQLKIKEKYYDIKIFYNQKEKQENLRHLLIFIKNQIMKKYIMSLSYNKTENYNCINIFGIGRKSINLIQNFIDLLNNENLKKYSIMIKFIRYNNLDILYRKKFSELNKKIITNQTNSDLHYNIEDEIIRNYLINFN